MKMNDKEPKCPKCDSKMKLLDVERYAHPNICDVYKLTCSKCNDTWHVAVRKKERFEDVWNEVCLRNQGK